MALGRGHPTAKADQPCRVVSAARSNCGQTQGNTPGTLSTEDTPLLSAIGGQRRHKEARRRKSPPPAKTPRRRPWRQPMQTDDATQSRRSIPAPLSTPPASLTGDRGREGSVRRLPGKGGSGGKKSLRPPPRPVVPRSLRKPRSRFSPRLCARSSATREVSQRQWEESGR